MTNKISGGRPPVVHTPKAEAKKPAQKADAPKKATTPKLPRSGWEDGAKLSKEIDRSRQATHLPSHPKLDLVKPARPDPLGGGDVHAPPIAMRYGVIRPDPHPPKPPPIAMRYGVIRPDPNHPPKPPPIAMRYGVIRPDPNHPPQPPPIAMRYGVIRPGPVEPPPIAMRYGVIRPQPREGIETKPR